MATRYRIVLAATMAAALGFGFLHHLVPGSERLLDRLHIFLFNLVCGGALALYFVERRPQPSWRVQLYFALALLYAWSGASERYRLTMALSVPMLVLVELVRGRRFSPVPVDLLPGRLSVADRFAHASLLCLSLGIVIADLVIVNQQSLHLVTSEKLTLDVFFLGYSFPVSLITMAVLFGAPARQPRGHAAARDTKSASGHAASASARRAHAHELAFWAVNLGVIVFFVLIVLGWLLAEIAIAAALLLLVTWLFASFAWRGQPGPARAWIASGLGFLVCSGVTGVLYLLRDRVPLPGRFVLTQHSFVALYGWNLVGLVAVARAGRLPSELGRPWFIALHWLTVLVLAPLGKTHPALAAVAVPAALGIFSVALLGPSPRAQEAL